LPFSQRDVNSKSFFFPVSVKANQQMDIHIRFSGTDSLTIAPFLYSQKVNENYKAYSNLFNGALIGIFVVMILYYLIIAIMLRDLHYFRYLFYLITTLFFMGTYYGYNLQLFWPNYPEFNIKMISSTVALSFFAGLLFSRNFLNTKKTMPKFDLVLKYIMYIFFSIIFLSFLIKDHFITVYAVVFLVTFYSAGLLFASFRSWQLKVPGSGFFILAWTFSVIGSFLASIMVQGYTDYSLAYYNFYGISTVADIVLLAFALAAKISATQKEKVIAQLALIDKEKEISNIHKKEKEKLEKVVELRTSELRERNKELECLSYTDKLTGIANRMKLDNVLDFEIKRTKRYKEQFGLIMLDIDYFKNVNDTFGHQVGDLVLQKIAHILKSNIRDTDTIGRWGGEEFLIICPKSNLDGLTSMAQILQTKIQNHNFIEVGQKTASFGITLFQDSDSIKDTIKRADDALYLSKRNGRNCITHL